MALRLTSMHVMDDEENENKRNGLSGVNRLKAMKEEQEDVPQPAANRNEPETEPTGVARLQALKNGQKQTTVTPAPGTPAPETPAPAAQQGRIRPGWDTADAAGASAAQDRREKPFTAAADDLRRLNNTAGVNIDDLREDLTQRAAERDAADSALGQIVEPWNRANATAQNLRSQVAAYETKLGMLQDTMDNSDDPEERRRAQQEARALDLGYQKAQRAAERYESRYNELNTQFQQLAIARNKANRALETGMEQYDTLLSLGDKRAANYEQQARDLRDRYNAAYQSGMPNAWELQRQAENAEAKAAAERQNYAEYLAKTKGEGYASRYLQGIEDGNRAKAEKASFGEKVLNTVAGLGENFFSGVGGAPWIFMARLMEIPEDALYAITGNEAFNQDAPGRGPRTSQILQTNDPFRSDAEARKQRAGSLGGMLIDTGYAAGNMLGMTGLAGQVTGALSNTALMSKLSSIAESSTLATSPAARRGAQMAINALRSPGNLGVSLSSGVSSYSEALANGASFSQAMANGISKAVTEYVSNRLFSGMPLENAPGEKGYVTKAVEFLADKLGKSEALAAFNRSTGGKVLGWIYDKAGEGLEEVVTGLLDPIIDRMTYDKEADWLPKLDQLADEFLGGMMLSLLMSGGEAVLTPTMTRAQIAEDLVRQGVLEAEARKYAGMIYKDMKAAERAQKAVQEAAEADITEAPEAAAVPVEAAANENTPPVPGAVQSVPQTVLQQKVDKYAREGKLSGQDARDIFADPAAMQTLISAGLITGRELNDSEGRRKIADAAEKYAAQQAENRAQEEQQTDITPTEETPRTEGLRLPTAQETLTPAPERVNLLAQNRTEVNDNGTQTPAPAQAAGTVRNAPAEQSFAERARAAAETERSRAILDRSERRTGLGRFLQNYRETRAQQRADQQFAAQKQRAAQLQHQADARDLAYTSAAELGVAGGTEKSTMQVIPQDMLDRNQLAAKQAAARDGVDLQFVLGQGEALDDNGAAYNFRGWISADGKRMIVQADHSKLTWQQILSHEELHRLIKRDPEYRRTVESALLADKKLQPYLGGIVDRYVAAYHDMQVYDENKIIEEMLADYRAGFDMLDIYHGAAGNVAAKKAAAKDIRAAEKSLENRVNEQRPVSLADETKASRELDANYLAAVEAGDMETAQRMVDAAAERAGYSVKAWHQTAKDFTVFSTDNPLAGKNDSETPNGIFFKTNDHDIGLEGKKQMAMAINPGRTLNFKDRNDANAWYRSHVEGYDSLSKRMESALSPIDRELQNIEDKMFANNTTDEEYDRLDKEWNALLERMRTEEDRYRGQLRGLLDAYFLGENRPYDSIHLGYDGHRYVEGKRENVETYIVFSNKQAKSAAPVTYDDDGNVIPLNERFNTEEPDIRYSREIDPEEAARAETRALQPVSPGEYTGGPRSRGRSTNPRKKVSRVRTRAFELGGLYNEVEAQMAETQPEEFTYDPISEKRSMNEALGRLKKDFTGEAEKLASSDQWGGSDLDTAMGILYQYRQIGRETGDYSLFNEWSHVIQQKGTKGGQFVQAFAKYSRTATGVAQKAAENLRETTGKLNPRQQKLIEGHVSDILGAVDNDAEAAARDAVEKSKGKKGLQLPGGNDTQRARDAENVIKQIHKIFSRQHGRNHGLPVEEWTKATGDQLAGRIASRLKEPGTKTQTTMQTILGDLITFAQEHALPTQEARQHRTALDRVTDYLNNREAYAEAWGEAKQVLRDMYADDAEKLEALESFLNATITYNGDDFDRTMYRAILEASDLLGMDKQDILDLAAVGTTESVINRIADEFVRRVGVNDATLRDTVRRHVENIVREGNVDGRLERMESEASKQLDIKIQDLLRESRRTKADAANRIAQYLINDLGISGTDAAIAANHIAGHYMDQLQKRADRVVERMFAEKKAITKKQRDKLLDLIHLGGLTNANVEDAVVDALGLNKVSREKQRQIMDAMAQFADTLDAIEDNDLEGLRSLIRQQAAIRNTKLDRLAEKVLSGETDAEYLRSLAMAQLDLIAADYQARTRGEKISTIQVISHLLNARTAMRNLGSNQVFDLVDSLANNAGLLPDMIMSKITGQRSVGLNKSWASQQKRQGAIKGAGRNLLEIALDAAPNDRNQSKYGTGGRRTFSMANSGTVGKILSKLEQVLGYELNTTDEFHKGSVFGETIESLARWVDAGYMTMEEAEEFATEMMLYRSFQDSTIVGSILGGLKDVMNIVGTGKTNGKTIKGMPVHDWGLGDLVVKYTQVPGALVHRAIEYSPVGYLKAIYHMAQLANAKTKGESTIKQQRKAALALGRATTGTGLITLFALMAKAGLLLRGDDEKDKNAAALKASQGLSGTQLNLTAIERLFAGESTDPQKGDVLADIGFLEPLDSLMTIAALINSDPELKGHDLYEFFHDPKTAGKTLEKSLEGIWLALENTSAMQTLSNIYSTVRYHDEENDLPLHLQIPLEIASSNISGFIPAPVRQAAQATDTTYRDQYRSQNFFSQTGAKVANAIPGLRQQLAPKITPLGEDKQYQAPALNALNALLNPGNISVYQTTDVIDELDRVYAETGDAKIWPERNAPYKTTINKASYTLTPDERTQYQRTRGQLTSQMMKAVMDADWYSGLNEAQKADVLNWIGNFSNYAAKVEFAEGRGMDYSSNNYAKYYDSLLSGNAPADVVAEAKQKTIAASAEASAAVIGTKKKGGSSGRGKTYSMADQTNLLASPSARMNDQDRELYDMESHGGNVNLRTRKIVPVTRDNIDTVRGWGMGSEVGDYMTVASQTYRDGDRAVVVTPILPDGSLMTQTELDTYMDSLRGSDNYADADERGIILGVFDSGTWQQNLKDSDVFAERVHELHEEREEKRKTTGLKLPSTPERREPISSGLRLQSAPAARPSSGGLRLK